MQKTQKIKKLMAHAYTAYTFTVNPFAPGAEILMAQLSEFDFESFEEIENGLKAYIQEELDSQELLKDVAILKNPEFKIEFTKEVIKAVNWNEAWEKNFDPIEVNGKCRVRAPFHPKQYEEYDIVIVPKMSFGTGHHETTYLMLRHLLKNFVAGKSVLDMGCGTGVLAILASMRGAKKVDAIDIDAWCQENAIENAARNNIKNIEVRQGDVNLLKGKNYDLILANINKNVLLSDISAYAKCLHEKGELYLSGFYTEDIPDITSVCNTHGLNFIMNFEKNNWVACKFVKN